MKKTLFLSAILGTALCSSAFAETSWNGQAKGAYDAVTSADGSKSSVYVLYTRNSSNLVLTTDEASFDISPDSDDPTTATVTSMTSSAAGANFYISSNAWGYYRSFASLTVEEAALNGAHLKVYNSNEGGTINATIKHVTGTLGSVDNTGTLTLGTTGSTTSMLGSINNIDSGTMTLNGTFDFSTASGFGNYQVARAKYATAEGVEITTKGLATKQKADYYAIHNSGTGSIDLSNATVTGAVLQDDGSYTISGDSFEDMTHPTYVVLSGNSAVQSDLTGATDLILAGGTATLSSHAKADAGVTGNIEVQAGSTLNLTCSDALGWGDGGVDAINMKGTSGKLATVAISGSNSQSLGGSLSLNGFSKVTGGSFIATDGSISATGTENEISSAITLRHHMSITVAGKNDTLTISGVLNASTPSGQSGENSPALNKAGLGQLILSGGIDSTSTLRDVVVNGADTTSITGETIRVQNDSKSITLNHVALDADAHTIVGRVTVADSSVRGQLTNNGTLTFSGTMKYTGNAATTEQHEAEVTQNGFGTDVTTKTYTVLAEGGAGTVTNNATWKVGDVAATYTDGTLQTVQETANTIYHVVSTVALNSIQGQSSIKVENGGKLTISGTKTTIGAGIDNTHGGVLSFSNASGYFAANNTNIGDIELNGANALTLTDGYSHSYGYTTHIGSISGTGTLSTSNDKAPVERIEVAGDVANTISFSGGRTNADSVTTIAFTKTGVDNVILADVTNSTATLNFEAAAVTVNSLTLNSGSIGVYTSFDANNKEANVTTLTTSALTVNDNAKLYANLVVNGGSLTFADGSILTMGCDVKIGTEGTVEVVLTDAMVQSIAQGGHVVLFDSVESATLGDHITFSGNLLNPTNAYALAYDETAKTIYVTPEPATATLSLLALAGLAARRKRH